MDLLRRAVAYFFQVYGFWDDNEFFDSLREQFKDYVRSEPSEKLPEPRSVTFNQIAEQIRVDFPDLESEGVSLGPVADAANFKIVFVDMPQQEHLTWSWAATAVALGNFYHGRGKYSQSRLVEEMFPSQGSPAPSAFGSGRPSLELALAQVGVGSSVLEPVSMEAIRAEVRPNRPVAVEVQWNSGGTHHLAIIGYHFKSATLIVMDPWYPAFWVKLTSLISEYQAEGSTIKCYKTWREDGHAD
jgi:hypothetical protein